MQDIYQYDWKGPVPARWDEIERLPDKQGIYLFSNSSSPFLAHSHEFCVKSGDPSLSKPRILYVGMTRASIRQRLKQHSIFQKIAATAEISEIFIYWLETEDPRDFEERLHSQFKPVFNLIFKSRIDVADDAANANVVSAGIASLEALIEAREISESAYQRLFVKYPFILGGVFTSVQAHQKLDDENIPDFTGVRSKDGFLDIIEIKQPFLQLASDGGELRSEFNKAWNQAERYLDFARMEADYLRRQKFLNFENPYCYLIVGINPCDSLKKEIYRKQRLNPGIIFLTYDQILNTAKYYQRFISEISEPL